MGLWIRDIPLSKVDVLHVQTLIASAIRCTDMVGPMVGKRKREIHEACCTATQSMNANLETVTRFRNCEPCAHDSAKMLRMDERAVDLLREKQVRRHKRRVPKRWCLRGPPSRVACSRSASPTQT